jgi:PhzF family phenazine biosynthesis protein
MAICMIYYEVDVFTDHVFGGNPAGVCPLESWLPDDVMQNIAMENNLSETAFFVKRDGYYDLRWFTPTIEVDLCGHATMATAFVIFNKPENNTDKLVFHSMSGALTVTREDNGMLWLDFPSRPGVLTSNYRTIGKALHIERFKTYKSVDILIVVENDETVRNIDPDFNILTMVKDEAEMPGDNFSVIVTAQGQDCDFVSRVFAPNSGIDEDPVTGSAHCVLIPYWAKRLGKSSLYARQISERGGRLWCIDEGDRVKIGGKAIMYMRGEIMI